MNGRTTVFDAFNAAAGATRATLGFFDDRMRNQAEAHIQNYQIQLQERAAEYIHNVENGIISNDDDDFLPGWVAESAKLRLEAEKNAKHPYTQRAIKAMFDATDARMRPALEAARRKIEIETALAIDGDTMSRADRAGPAAAGVSQSVLDRNYLNGYISTSKYISGSDSAYYNTWFTGLQREIDQAIESGLVKTKDELNRIVDNYNTKVLSRATLERYDSKGGWDKLPLREKQQEKDTTEAKVEDQQTSPVDESGWMSNEQRIQFVNEIDRLDASIRQRRENKNNSSDKLKYTEITEALKKSNIAEIEKWKDENGNSIFPTYWKISDMELLQERVNKLYKTSQEKARVKNAPQDNTADVPDQSKTYRPTEGFQKVSVDTTGLNGQIVQGGKDYVDQKWEGYVVGKQKQNAQEIAIEYGDALIAVIRGKPEAWDMVNKGIRTVRSKENPFLSENDRTEYNTRYANLLKTLQEGSGGSGRGNNSTTIKALEDVFKNARYLYQVASTKHENEATYIQGREAFRNFVYKTVMDELGVPEKEVASYVDLYFSQVTKFDKWAGELATVIGEVDPNFNPKTNAAQNQTTVMGRITGIVNGIAKDKKLNDTAKKTLLAQVSDAVYGRVADLGVYHFTHDEWVDWANNLACLAVSGKISLGQVTNDPKKLEVKDLSGFFDTKKQIKMLQQAEANPDLIDEYDGQTRFVGNKQDWDNYQDFVRRDIANQMGVDEKFVRASWVNDNRRQDSVIGVPQITITSGPNAGTYRQSTDGEKVFTYKWVKDAQGKGSWEKVSDRTSEQRDSDQKKAVNESEQTLDKYQYNSGTAKYYVEDILKSHESDKRTAYNNAKIKMRAEGMDDSYIDDEFYMRRIDPKTFKQLQPNDITDSRLKELLERNFGHRATISEVEYSGLLNTFPSNRQVISSFFEKIKRIRERM